MTGRPERPAKEKENDGAEKLSADKQLTLFAAFATAAATASASASDAPLAISRRRTATKESFIQKNETKFNFMCSITFISGKKYQSRSASFSSIRQQRVFPPRRARRRANGTCFPLIAISEWEPEIHEARSLRQAAEK